MRDCDPFSQQVLTPIPLHVSRDLDWRFVLHLWRCAVRGIIHWVPCSGGWAADQCSCFLRAITLLFLLTYGPSRNHA